MSKELELGVRVHEMCARMFVGGHQRSLSPVPTTLDLADVTRLDAVRGRLLQGLRTCDTLAEARTVMAELAADLESVTAPTRRTLEEDAPDTEREPPSRRPWDGEWHDDCAPSTPVRSVLGEEYGI